MYTSEANETETQTNQSKEVEKMGILNRSVRYHKLSELKPSTNLRVITPEMVEEMKGKLLIQGEVTILGSFLILPRDEDGLYPVHDGMTRLATLHAMNVDASFEIPTFQISVEEAKNPELLLEIQEKLGTSNNRLLPHERANGYAQWVEKRKQRLMSESDKLSESKAFAKAKKEAAATFGVNAETITKSIAFVSLPSFLQERTFDGTIAGMFDSVEIYAQFNKTVESGYTGSLEDFFAVAQSISADRKGKSVNGDDSKAAKDSIISEMKVSKSKELVAESEKAAQIQAAIDSGAIAPETIQAAVDVATEAGISLDEVLQKAVDNAEEIAEGETFLPTDEDVLRATKQLKKEAKVSELSELSDTTLLKQCLDFAISVMVFNIGNDPDETIAMLKKAVDSHKESFAEDLDRTSLESLYKGMRKMYEVQENAVKATVKRVENAAKAKAKAEKAETVETVETVESPEAVTV